MAETVIVRFVAAWHLDGSIAGFHIERQIPVQHGVDPKTGGPMLLGGPTFPPEPVPADSEQLAAVLGRLATDAMAKAQTAHAQRDAAVIEARDLRGTIGNWARDQQAEQTRARATVAQLGSRLVEAEEAAQRERDITAGLRARVAQLEAEIEAARPVEGR